MAPKYHLKIDGKIPSVWFPSAREKLLQLLFCEEKGGTQQSVTLITADYFL